MASECEGALRGPGYRERKPGSMRDTARRVAAEYQRRLVLGMNVSEAQAVLGVRPTASKSEILKAYKALALKHHTDRGGNRESMVEINVARDVLLSGRSIKYNKRESPESTQREEDIRALSRMREKVQEAVSAIKNDLSTDYFTHRINLRDYLVGEMADICDDIEDRAADVSTDRQQSEETRERAKKIGVAVKSVLASAVKLATKYGAIFKGSVVAGPISYADAEKVYKLLAKFVPALQDTHREAQKLSGLLFDLVGTLQDEHPHPIPEALSDEFYECQEMLRAFKQDYTAVPTRGLTQLESAMKSVHKEAREILDRYGLDTVGADDWRQWRMPDDLDDAVEALRGLRRAATVRAVG